MTVDKKTIQSTIDSLTYTKILQFEITESLFQKCTSTVALQKSQAQFLIEQTELWHVFDVKDFIEYKPKTFFNYNPACNFENTYKLFFSISPNLVFIYDFLKVENNVSGILLKQIV